MVKLQSWLGSKNEVGWLRSDRPSLVEFERVKFVCFASISAEFCSCVFDVELLSLVVGRVVIAETTGAIAESQLSL